MKIPAYHVDTFAGAIFSGNPAMVCLLDRWLDDETLQLIARENHLPVTSFFVELEDGYELRWFTPTIELNLCGHGTMAAAAVLFDSLKVPKESVAFKTRGGVLVAARGGPLLHMDFPILEAVPCSTRPEDLVRALGREPEEILKAQNQNYLAVYEGEADIRAMAPDLELLQEVDCLGAIVTSKGRAPISSRATLPRGSGSPKMLPRVRRTARWDRTGPGDSGDKSSTRSNSPSVEGSYGASLSRTESGLLHGLFSMPKAFFMCERIIAAWFRSH